MVELRKRKEAPPGQAPQPVKKANSVKSSTSASTKKEETLPAESTPKKLAAGDQISLDAFGGEIETNDGEKTSLKKLVEESKAGVVLFTYPKASTPGCEYQSDFCDCSICIISCHFNPIHMLKILYEPSTLLNWSSPGTTQACLFRDEFTPLTATGFSIYGLSTDSPKANTSFKEKHSLPYTLLCDPKATLIGAIGMKKAPSGTTRGVVVFNKEGRVEAAEPGVSLVYSAK